MNNKIVFEGIPEKDIATYSVAVEDVLDKLNYPYDFIEVSPPQDDLCTLIVYKDQMKA